MPAVTPHYCSHDQTIFDLAPFPMWIYDLLTFRFLAVNKEAVRQYGYSRDELLTMTIKDIRPGEDIPRLEKAVRSARKRKEPYKESLFRHQRRDGSIVYVEIKSNLIDFLGKHAEIVTAIDLTDRHEREQKIAAQQECLKAVVTISRLLLESGDWLEALDRCFEVIGGAVDIDRIYFFQNSPQDGAALKRLEWNRGGAGTAGDDPQPGGIPFSDIPLFMEPLRKNCHFEAVVDALPPSPARQMLEREGTKSILLLPVTVDSDFCGFIGFEDCRQQRKFPDDELQLLNALASSLGHVLKQHDAHQKLAFSEGRFKSLIENGRDLLAILDEKGNYKYVAPTSKTVLGIPAEEFLGKNAFDFIYEEDLPRLRQQLGAIQDAKYVSVAPYRFPDAQGNLRWIRTELSNHLKTPLIEGIVANTHEVTAEIEQKIVNDLLEELTMAIAQPSPLVSSLNGALGRLVGISKISASEIWLAAPDHSQLNLVSKACQDARFDAFYRNPQGIASCKKQESLPGTVWERQRTTIFEDLPSNSRFARSEDAKLANLSTGIGFPIVYGDQFLGCIICYSEAALPQLSYQVSLLMNVTEKLGALVKQKVTEEEYRNFFNISPDPHCIVGFDGYIKKCNKAFVALTGYPEKYLYSVPVSQIMHREDGKRANERLLQLIDGYASEPFKGRFMTSQGQVKWLLWSATVAPESKTIIAVGKDITEQTLAEQKLQTAYGRLKTAQKIAKLGYWYRDIDSDLSIWSEETYAIYDCSPENFSPTRQNLDRIFRLEDRYLIEGDPAACLEPGKTKSFEHEIITATGKAKWVRQEVRLLAGEQGGPMQLEGTIQDITERKEHERQLYLSNEIFKLAMQASNEMIWDADLINKRLTRRKDHRKTFDYVLSESFSIDNSWFGAIEPCDRDKVWKSLEAALRDKGQNSWSTEYRIVSSEGSVAYFVDRCSILRDGDGKPVRLVGAALDVSASRRQLERIKRQNESLREIAWIQSHVFRAPLTRIMGLVYLSQELEGGGKSKDEILQMIMESAKELDGVISQITERTNLTNDEDAANIID